MGLTCRTDGKILDLNPETFTGFVFFQRWKQLGGGGRNRCRLNGPGGRLVAGTATGVAATGTGDREKCS